MKSTSAIYLLLTGLLFACGDPETNTNSGSSASTEPAAKNDPKDDEARALLDRIEDDAVFESLVKLGRTQPLIEATATDRPPAVRRRAAVALGRVAKPGDTAAAARLVELLEEQNDDPIAMGWMHLYAAVGLTGLQDPATAVRLLLNLSTINQNDSLAARAAQEKNLEYFTVDAQICDALLGMGLYEAEESLVEQLRRKHRIRVSIDANAVLRRRTGIDLNFRYNGSFRSRNKDAAAWEKRLRATRNKRFTKNRFDENNAGFQKGLDEMLSWLRGTSVRHRLMSGKVLRLLGPVAVKPLESELKRDNPIARRHAAKVLGWIGDARAADSLTALLDDTDADARAAAIDALRSIGHRAAADRVRKKLDDADPEARAAAARFLGAMGADGDVKTLRHRLGQETHSAAHTAIVCALLLRGAREDAEAAASIFQNGELLDRRAIQAALEEASGKPLEVGADADPKARAGFLDEFKRMWSGR
ncbi:MAG: HEAT repeat domain-containing protein [Planctomycetota bacterium]